ncbi:MAG: hypothetical protein SCK57_11080 [Bacillota bacterium]|nr:hypothetical protein [Bacillota bacterium]MDW7678194.1 hypothetical protein [Bacillota bacterium]
MASFKRSIIEMIEATFVETLAKVSFGELFIDFRNELMQSDTGIQMVITFIDLMADDVSVHGYMKLILEKGYKLPLTFINEQPAYAGGLDSVKILRAARKII